jgi:hypothetical protein
MDIIEAMIWVALGFIPTLAAMIGISKAKIFRIRKYGRIAKIEIGYPRSLQKIREVFSTVR